MVDRVLKSFFIYKSCCFEFFCCSAMNFIQTKGNTIRSKSNFYLGALIIHSFNDHLMDNMSKQSEQMKLGMYAIYLAFLNVKQIM